MNTLLHHLAGATREDRGITLLHEQADGPTVFRSWPEIARRAWGRAAKLQAAGVRPGDRVLLALPTGFGFIETFFGLQVAGAVPVPAYPPPALDRVSLAIERLEHIARDAGATLCLTDRQLLPLLGSLAVGKSPIRAVRDVDAFEGPGAATPPALEPDALAFIQYTSGSTDNPKGVQVLHRGALANCRAMIQATGTTDDDVVVSWLPLYHDLGLICSLQASLYADVPLVLMPPQAFLLQPDRWLRTISEYRGTICQAPTFAYARTTKRMRKLDGVDLSSWRVALVTAEPVDRDVVEAFADRFAAVGLDRNALRPAYGLAESTAGVTYPDQGASFDVVDRERLAEGIAVPADEGVTVANLGRPLPDHEIRVVREDATPCEDREVGQIEVRGPSTMAGYHQRDRADVFTDDGWLRTFDLGYLVDGELYLCGREKEIIIVRGRKYHPEDIERAACEVPEVKPGGVIAFAVYDDQRGEDDIVIVCEVPQGSDVERRAITDSVQASVRERTGLSVREVVLVPSQTLPKTSSGKRQRRKTRDLWATGALHGPRKTGKVALAATVARSGIGLIVGRLRGR